MNGQTVEGEVSNPRSKYGLSSHMMALIASVLWLNQDTDTIIDMIGDHKRSEAEPLVLRLMPPRAKAAAAAAVAVEPATAADFLPAAEFDGAKPGYAFRSGEQGTGYYKEVGAADSGAAVQPAVSSGQRVRWADEAADANEETDDMFAPQVPSKSPTRCPRRGG